MRFGRFEFGSIQIDGVFYQYDVVIDGGRIRKRKKKPSKPFCGSYGDAPLSAAEDIPWHCEQLLVGTGAYGALPIMAEVEREAQARRVSINTVQRLGAGSSARLATIRRLARGNARPADEPAARGPGVSLRRQRRPGLRACWPRYVRA